MNNTTDIENKKLFFIAVAVNVTLFAAFRNVLLKANKKLSQVLVEVLKTTAAAEETLGLHMQSLSASSGAPHSTTQRATWERVDTKPFRPHAAGK